MSFTKEQLTTFQQMMRHVYVSPSLDEWLQGKKVYDIEKHFSEYNKDKVFKYSYLYGDGGYCDNNITGYLFELSQHEVNALNNEVEELKKKVITLEREACIYKAVDYNERLREPDRQAYFSRKLSELELDSKEQRRVKRILLERRIERRIKRRITSKREQSSFFYKVLGLEKEIRDAESEIQEKEHQAKKRTEIFNKNERKLNQLLKKISAKSFEWFRDKKSRGPSITEPFQIEYLGMALKNTKVTSLSLVSHNIREENSQTLQALGKMLQTTNVTSLNLAKNEIANHESLKALGSALRKTKVVNLDLSNNHFLTPHSIEPLSNLLKGSKITSLNLSDNQISDPTSLKELGSALEGSNVTCLKLRGLKLLKDSKLKELIELVKKSKVTSLHLTVYGANNENTIEKLAVLSEHVELMLTKDGENIETEKPYVLIKQKEQVETDRNVLLGSAFKAKKTNSELFVTGRQTLNPDSKVAQIIGKLNNTELRDFLRLSNVLDNGKKRFNEEFESGIEALLTTKKDINGKELNEDYMQILLSSKLLEQQITGLPFPLEGDQFTAEMPSFTNPKSCKPQSNILTIYLEKANLLDGFRSYAQKNKLSNEEQKELAVKWVNEAERELSDKKLCLLSIAGRDPKKCNLLEKIKSGSYKLDQLMKLPSKTIQALLDTTLNHELREGGISLSENDSKECIGLIEPKYSGFRNSLCRNGIVLSIMGAPDSTKLAADIPNIPLLNETYSMTTKGGGGVLKQIFNVAYQEVTDEGRNVKKQPRAKNDYFPDNLKTDKDIISALNKYFKGCDHSGSDFKHKVLEAMNKKMADIKRGATPSAAISSAYSAEGNESKIPTRVPNDLLERIDEFCL